MNKESFFLMCAGIGAAAGVVTWLFNFPLKPILDAKPVGCAGIGRAAGRPAYSSGPSHDRSTRRSMGANDRMRQKPETIAVHAGRMTREHFGAVNTPVYRASTILYPDLASLEAGKAPYRLWPAGTPTSQSFEDAVTALEGGARTVVVPSGLARDHAGAADGLRRGRSSAGDRQLLLARRAFSATGC